MPEWIQFDPFSFGVAIIAVAVSLRALYLSKRAPQDERLRTNRDAIRAALREAEPQIFSAKFALDQGQTLDDIPPAIDAAHSILKQSAPRLPERLELIHLDRFLFEAGSQWRSANHWADLLELARDDVAKWETVLAADSPTGRSAEAARENLAGARRQQEKARTGLDAARISLRDTLGSLRAESTKYVNKLDNADRTRKA